MNLAQYNTRHVIKHVTLKTIQDTWRDLSDKNVPFLLKNYRDE